MHFNHKHSRAFGLRLGGRRLRTVRRAMALVCAWALSTSPFWGSPTCAVEDAANYTDAITIAKFQIAAHGAPLILPVTIAGRIYPFLVDTGAVVCLLDRSFEAQVERSKGTDVPEPPTPPPTLYRPPPMSIGPIDTGRPECILRSGFHDAMYLALGEDIYGILGMNVLREHIVDIDFDDGRLRFLRALPADRQTRLALDAKHGRFYVAAKLSDQDERFLVDTGHVSFYSGAIRKPVFDKMAGSAALHVFGNCTGLSMSGAARVRAADVDVFRLASFEHKHLVFCDTDQETKLGLGYWSRFRVTFDFPRSALYIRPAGEFTRRDSVPLEEFELALLLGAYIIVSLEPGGTAEAAGLKPWDEMKAVDGRPLKGMSMWEVQRRFTRPGTCRIDYIRNGVPGQVTLMFKDPRGSAMDARSVKSSSRR